MFWLTENFTMETSYSCTSTLCTIDARELPLPKCVFMDSGAQKGLENRVFLWGKYTFFGNINKMENLVYIITSTFKPKKV